MSLTWHIALHMHSSHCTLHIALYALHTHGSHCTLHTHSSHCTLHFAHAWLTLTIAHCTCMARIAQQHSDCTRMARIAHALHIGHCTGHIALHTHGLHCTLHMHGSHCTWHIASPSPSTMARTYPLYNLIPRQACSHPLADLRGHIAKPTLFSPELPITAW